MRAKRKYFEKRMNSVIVISLLVSGFILFALSMLSLNGNISFVYSDFIFLVIVFISIVITQLVIIALLYRIEQNTSRRR
jgi:ABC-type transport system involved in multi-copper enzyme maturation permease subunit